MKGGKGFRGSARRASLLPVRYGLTPEKLQSRLRRMAAALARWGAMPTVPVTASNLDRHPEIVDDVRALDPAIHGYRHVPYGELSRRDQARDLDLAVDAFQRHGLPVRGFRAPYLSANPSTLELLRERGFAYDSSSAAFALPRAHPIAARAAVLAEARYGPLHPGPDHPRVLGDLIELPVALPDDEILVDGLGIDRPEELAQIFEAMVEHTLQSGGLLVFQVHPERFHLCSDAIESVLRFATDRGAWIAPLSEIAAHASARSTAGWPKGSAMALAVTGDLDAVSIFDFAHRLWEA